MENSIEHVMTDYEGNLWFTSSRLGVMKVVPNQFADVFLQHDLPATVVNSTCMYDQQLFMGTDDGLLVVADGEKITSLPLTKAVSASGTDLGTSDLIEYLDGVRIRSIIRDSRERLWISTWRKYGLLRYDHGELMAFTPEDGLFSDRVRVICERKDGTIMVVNTGGISIIEDDRVIQSFGVESGIVNTEILTAAEGTNGDIILGSDGGGIYVIGKNGTRHIGYDDGLAAEVIMRVKRDPYRNVYWIITTNSIAYMDDEYHVKTIQNFPYPNNFDIFFNSHGEAWVLAGSGIYVLPAEELLNAGDLSPLFYSHDNGLPCITTANSYSELTADGDLYISGTTCVCKVNIEKPFEDVDSLKAAVPYIEADGKTIYPDDSGIFTIPSRAKKLTIPSFVFTYTLLNPQVSYMLEGFEQESTTVQRRDLAPVDYTNLSGGTYNFTLHLMDSMGKGNKVYAFQIIKEKKLYENTWFIIAAALFFIFILEENVRLAVHRKTRHLERQHQIEHEQFEQTAEALVGAIDAKDRYTNGHSRRVAKYSQRLAELAAKSKDE